MVQKETNNTIASKIRIQDTKCSVTTLFSILIRGNTYKNLFK